MDVDCVPAVRNNRPRLQFLSQPPMLQFLSDRLPAANEGVNPYPPPVPPSVPQLSFGVCSRVHCDNPLPPAWPWKTCAECHERRRAARARGRQDPMRRAEGASLTTPEILPVPAEQLPPHSLCTKCSTEFHPETRGHTLCAGCSTQRSDASQPKEMCSSRPRPMPSSRYTTHAAVDQDITVSRHCDANVYNLGSPPVMPHFNARGELIDPAVEGVPHIKISKRSPVLPPSASHATPGQPSQIIAVPHAASPAVGKPGAIGTQSDGQPDLSKDDGLINTMSIPEPPHTPPVSSPPAIPVPDKPRLTIKLPARKKKQERRPLPASMPIQIPLPCTRICETPECGRVIPMDSTSLRCDTCSLKRWNAWQHGGRRDDEDPRKGQTLRKARSPVNREGGSRDTKRARTDSSRTVPFSVDVKLQVPLTSLSQPTKVPSGDVETSQHELQSEEKGSTSPPKVTVPLDSVDVKPASVPTMDDKLGSDLDDLGELCYPEEDMTGAADGERRQLDVSTVGHTESQESGALQLVSDCQGDIDVDREISINTATRPKGDPAHLSSESPCQVTLYRTEDNSDLPHPDRAGPLDESNPQIDNTPLAGDTMSDLSDLTPVEDSTDSGETEVDPAESDEEVATEARLVGFPLSGLALGALEARICNHPKCKNPLPSMYRWKLCVQCREKNRLYQRKRLGWDVNKREPESVHDVNDDPASMAALDIPPGSAGRVCSRRNCKNILHESYRWKLCERCRHKKKSSPARRRFAANGGSGQVLDGEQIRDNEETESDNNVPQKSVKGQYSMERVGQQSTKEGIAAQRDVSEPAGITAVTLDSVSAPDLRVCRTPFCGILLPLKTRSKFCDNCRHRTSIPHEGDDEVSEPDIPLSTVIKLKRGRKPRAKRKSGVLGVQKGGRKSSLWAGFVPPVVRSLDPRMVHFQHFGALVKVLKTRLSGFFNAQGLYMRHKIEQRGNIDSDSELPVIFEFDGEYSIVAYSWHHPSQVQYWADDTTKAMEDGLGLKFHLIGSFIAHGGAIVTRFHCQHDIIVPIGPQPPETTVPSALTAQEFLNDTAGILVKRMAGELELMVLADRTHPFIPGQKIAVRFRMVG